MVRILDGEFYFDYHQGDLLIADIHLGIPGNHNVENAVAAITAALLLNIPVDGIKKALSNFKGVKRRFEYIVKGDHNIYIDDYAHHPAELKAFFMAVNSLYPNKKLTAVFQPHLFTRTRDFIEDFASALSMVDELLLMPIYPAREKPIEGVTSEWLLDKITIQNKRILDHKGVEEFVKQEMPELIVTVGAGNIDRLVKPIKQKLENA